MAPRRKSNMWEHFSESVNDKAKCRYCSTLISVTAGSFGNMGRHLRTKQPAVIISKQNSIDNEEDSSVIDDPGINFIFLIV